MSRVRVLLLMISAFPISVSIYGQVQLTTSELVKDTVHWKLLSEGEYEIQYPDSWEVSNSGQMGTTFVILSPLSSELDQFRENVNLMVQDLAGYSLTLDQYVELSENQIETLITDGKISFSERQEREGVQYHKAIYTGRQGIFKLKFEQLYWLVGDTAYILTLTCEEDQYEKYKEIGGLILKSFELKKS